MHISQRYYDVIIRLLESITIIYPFHNVMIALCVAGRLFRGLPRPCGNGAVALLFGRNYCTVVY